VALTGGLSLETGGAPLAIGQAQALIWHPDGEAERLALNVTGSGFTGEWQPDGVGVYQLDIVVSAQTPDGTPVERTAFLAIQAQPRPTPVRAGLAVAALVGGVLCLLLAIVLGPLWLGWRLVRRRRKAGGR
jgi:hypothetical protein